MSLSIGIVGLPNVGKSTLFNALTKNDILAANYPFATIEPNTGIVPVPDERLEKLSKLYNDAPIVPATVTFVDIAGLVKGAAEGEGLGNKFLSHIRECQAIVQVVRAFEDSNVVHVHDEIDPGDDIETVNTELILADLQTIDSRLTKLEKEARANSKLQSIVDILKQTKDGLNQGKLAGSFLDEEQREIIRDLQLLTAKPFIVAFNLSDQQLSDSQLQKKLQTMANPSPSIFLSAKIESELKDLDERDRMELLASFGQDKSGLQKLINEAYSALGLQSYLTAGEKEVRAWTIAKGSTAPQAAGVIHGDFERGFIAAQIINYDDLVQAGSEQTARQQGKIRTEGKTYVMQPGDVVEFRFNV